MTIAEHQTLITRGVDIYVDFHATAAVCTTGGVLASRGSRLAAPVTRSSSSGSKVSLTATSKRFGYSWSRNDQQC